MRLFHVSDLHFGREDRAAVAWFADRVRAERPDAVICTGDLTMRARAAEFAQAQAWLQSLGVPVTVEPGNHDLPYFNPLARLIHPYQRYRAVERAIERPLALPGVLLVPLKTTQRLPLRGWSRGRVSRSGLPAAERLLAAKPAGALALVAVHHPLGGAGLSSDHDTLRGAAALARLAAAGADAVLSGHVHRPFDVAYPAAGRSVRLVGAGTLSIRLRDAPPSFNELRIADGRLDVLLHERR